MGARCLLRILLLISYNGVLSKFSNPLIVVSNTFIDFLSILVSFGYSLFSKNSCAVLIYLCYGRLSKVSNSLNVESNTFQGFLLRVSGTWLFLELVSGRVTALGQTVVLNLVYSPTFDPQSVSWV